MSAETTLDLNTFTLIGFAAKRGTAWHYRADLQGAESNHYDGAIPVDDVLRRLFHWEAAPAPVAYLVPCAIDDARVSGVDANGAPYRLVVDETRNGWLRFDNDHPMGVFGQGYVGHQYPEWLLDGPAQLISASSGDLAIGSAGLLRQGARAWVSVEMPENIVTPSGVAFRPHLLACTSFDGSLSTTYKRVMTNVVCDNTMAIALGEHGEAFKARHSKYSGMKLGAARDAVGIVHTMADDLGSEIEALIATAITDDEFRRIVAGVFPASSESPRAITTAAKMADTLTNLWENDVRVAPFRGTAWGTVQAVNTWAHHVKTVTRGRDRGGRNMDDVLSGDLGKLDARTIAEIAKVRSLVTVGS